MTETQKANEEKKEFLNRYRALRKRVRHFEEEIETVRSQYTGRAIQYSDMPKAHNTEHDLSDYAARVDDMLREIEALRWECINAYHFISSAIEDMTDDREKDLLRLRYLMCKSWEEVAVDMGYNIRWVYRIHGNALQHFNKPF